MSLANQSAYGKHHDNATCSRWWYRRYCPTQWSTPGRMITEGYAVEPSCPASELLRMLARCPELQMLHQLYVSGPI